MIGRRDRLVGGSGEITADWGPQGLQITDQRPRPVWARITGSSGALYSWAEVDASDTSFPDLGSSFAQTGEASADKWPAYEISGSTSVATGTKVQLWPSPTGSFWLFKVDAGGGGSGITVEEADGSPSYSSITTLRFDQADGFTVTNPSAGVARVDWASVYATARTPVGGGNYSITADVTWEDTGASVTLPAAGSYLINAFAGGVILASGTPATLVIQARVYSVAAAAMIGVVFEPVQNTTDGQGTNSLSFAYTGGAGEVLKLQALRSSGTWTTSEIYASSFVEYIRLA